MLIKLDENTYVDPLEVSALVCSERANWDSKTLVYGLQICLSKHDSHVWVEYETKEARQHAINSIVEVSNCDEIDENWSGCQ